MTNMQPLTQFQLKLDDGTAVLGEYEGNEDSKKVIIFSHGFGVTRDSRGMFNELGDVLKEDYLVVRFDYAIVNKRERWTKVYPYSKQAEMLKRVVEYVREKFSPGSVNIIGHSMGCLIAGLAKIEDVDKILLLASAPTAPYRGMKEYFSERPETKIDEQGMSEIKRSDGSITYVGSDFWQEMKDIKPDKLFAELVKQSDIYFIRASDDEVITGESYEGITSIKGLKYSEIKAKHDFTDEAREILISRIRKIFL